MTENVKTFELKINGINSVKELKQHISDLRDRLVALDDTSEEYSQTVDELVDSQKKLSSVMSASKESITGATGSYNSLVNEMSALKKVWREVTSEAERAKIGTRINEINEELKRMDSTIGNSQRKVGSYEEAIKKALMTPQQELKKLKKELAGMEQGTAEYNATFARMAQLTHDVTEQQEMLKWSSADLGDILGNLVGVAQGVAGGFSAINAVSGLISDGNEDVEEAMLTAQRWLQLIQGLSALEELGDRLKGLWQGLKNYANAQNTAVASMGDFATNAEAVVGTTEMASQQIDQQATSMRQATNVTTQLTSATEKLNQVQLQQIASVEGMLDGAKDRLRTNKEVLEQLIEEGETDEEILSYHKSTIKSAEEQVERLKSKVAWLKRSNNITKEKIELEKADAVATETTTKASTKFGNALTVVGGKAKALATTIKTALISTGIGLLIVALGTAVSWLWKFVDGSAKAEERTKKLKDSVDALNESLERQEKSWEREEMLLEAQGASYEEIYEARKKNLQAQLAEVRANLATQKAIADDIGKRKLQKAKYDEFRQTLEELEETEKNLAEQISDLDYEKYIKGIKDAREEQKKQAEDEKKQAEERKRAWQERMKQIEAERKEAEKLYNELKNFYKSDTTKLKEKYLEDLKTLDKLNVSADEKIKAKQLLRYKYLYELNKLNMESVKALYDENRKYAQRAMEVYGSGTEEYIQKQIEEAERYKDAIQATLDNIERGNDASDELKFLNAFEGTEIRNIEDANVELKIAKNNINDLYKALLELQSSKVINKLNKDLETLGNESQISMDRFEMSIEETATRGSEIIKGFYTGTSPEEMRSQLEVRYQLQAEYLQKELDLYIEAQKQKNLTDEDRATIQANINAIQIAQQDLMTQKTIESNYLMIESYENMTNSIEGIAGAMSDILGSVSDMIMDNAERQLEAGEITEEEYNRQFEKAKAIQIAQATINTISGALGAFMGITRDTGGWGLALAIAQATSVLASGIVQIQKIKNTKPNGSGSLGGSSGRYAEVVPNPTNDYNPTLTQNITGQQESEDLANALSKKPIRAYVVESDITNAQGVAQQRTKESSF